MSATKTTIERLKKNKTEWQEPLRSQGKTAGLRWMHDRATYAELERLFAWLNPKTPIEEQDIFDEQIFVPYTVSEHFHSVIIGTSGAADRRMYKPLEADAAAEFWREHFGEEQPHAIVVSGFVQAAFAAYAEIREQL